MSKTQIVILLSLLCSIELSDALQDFFAISRKLDRIMRAIPGAAADAGVTKSILAMVLDSQSEVWGIVLQLNELVQEVNALEDKMVMQNMSGIIQTFPDEILPLIKLHEWKNLEDNVNLIKSEFHYLVEYVKQKKNIALPIWHHFSKSRIRIIEQNFLRYRNSMLEALGGKNGRDLSHWMADAHRATANCTSKAMAQYSLGLLLQLVMITEIKSGILSTYSNLYWVTPQKDDFYAEFQCQVSYFRLLMRPMFSSQPNLMPCDSHEGIRIRGETYFEIENLEQVVIFRYHTYLRPRNCNYAIEEDLFAFEEKRDYCSGKMSDCEFSTSLEVCRLTNSPKRYEWIKAAGGQYGRNFDGCPDGKISHCVHRKLNVIGHCMCKCRPSNQTNWISLESVLTDFTNNMVIIGLRFVLREGILYLQVKQGKLMANRQIDPSSQNWIPLPEYVETAKITPNQKFYLDNVYLPADYVAIGINFEHDDGIFIKITGQKINYLTGQLLPNRVEYVAEHANYSQLGFPRRNSIYTNLSHTIDSDKNWIKLQISDLKHDAGQSMLPLFDGIAVEPKPPLPIGGIEMVHKGVEGYAGYISLRLFLFDFGTFFDDLYHKVKA